MNYCFFFFLGGRKSSNDFSRPSVRLLLTKTHPCSFLCPLRSRTAVSLEQPAAPAGIGPDWPLQLLTSLMNYCYNMLPVKRGFLFALDQNSFSGATLTELL